MKEILTLLLFTLIPPIFFMLMWWFICWEIDLNPIIRSVMVIVGIAGFFLGLSCLSDLNKT